MKRFGLALLLVLAAVVSLPSYAEKVTDEQVLETFEAYMLAMKDGEYETMAGHIHPGELEEFKKLFVTLAESAEKDGAFAELAPLVGVETLEELKQAEPTELFANLFKMITAMMPEFGQILKSAEVDLLGQVTEGKGEDEIVHLVFRMRMKVNGAKVQSVDTAAMSKADDDKYYFMIGEEVQGLVNALKNQFGGVN